MSEPGTYGAGTIGIVSYKFERPVPPRMSPAIRIRNRQPMTAINWEAAWIWLVPGGYGNLAFAVCEMREQTGSASKTNRPLLPTQGSESLNSSPLATSENSRRF